MRDVKHNFGRKKDRKRDGRNGKGREISPPQSFLKDGAYGLQANCTLYTDNKYDTKTQH